MQLVLKTTMQKLSSTFISKIYTYLGIRLSKIGLSFILFIFKVYSHSTFFFNKIDFSNCITIQFFYAIEINPLASLCSDCRLKFNFVKCFCYNSH